MCKPARVNRGALAGYMQFECQFTSCSRVGINARMVRIKVSHTRHPISTMNWHIQKKLLPSRVNVTVYDWYLQQKSEWRVAKKFGERHDRQYCASKVTVHHFQGRIHSLTQLARVRETANLRNRKTGSGQNVYQQKEPKHGRIDDGVHKSPGVLAHHHCNIERQDEREVQH